MNAITEASTPSPRHDWTLAQAERLFALPFTTLLFEAQRTHQAYHDPATVQMSTLLSIKTAPVRRTAPTVRKAFATIPAWKWRP